jgi:tricorn protease
MVRFDFPKEGLITMRFKLTLVVLFLCITAATASAEVDARMLRYPDVSETHIAFVYAGDIWLVEKGGGTAHRLSSPPGEELFPRFSPDGTRLAYSANYDGNTDIYVIPAMGGSPTRVTYHPGTDVISEWTADGTHLMFSSRRASGVRSLSQFYLVSADGGFPETLPVPYGDVGALSASGRTIAYTTRDRGFRTWKRFRGGTAPDIWLFDLESLEARNLTDDAANDSRPMWHGDRLYFLSDRGPALRSNIWALDPVTGEMRQVTHFTDFDITFPAIGPSDIVFQAGGRLYLLGLDDEQYAEVEVDIVTDLASLRPRHINATDLIQGADISPSGKRVVIEARGEIFTVPAKHGVVNNLSRHSGSAERFPAWSPDGKQIAYWSDAGGEYELTLIPSGGGEAKTLTNLGPGFRYQLFWSPDSTKIAFIDHTQTIQVYDLETSTFTEVDKGLWRLHPELLEFGLSWSSDSRWITYSRGLETHNNAVFLFDTEGGARHQVTSGYYHDFAPVFDPDGKYLYYFSNRTLEPIYSDIDDTWVYPNTTNIVAVPLRADVASPLAPRNDVEEVKEEEADDEAEDADEKKKGKKKGKKAEDEGENGKDEKKPEPVKIDLEGFEQRVVVLPLEAGKWGGLAAVSGKVIFQRAPRSGASDEQYPIGFWDLEEREEETILDDATVFVIAADGKKMLVRSRDTFAIVDIQPGQKIGGKGNENNTLDTSKLEMTLDPRAEWRQLFNDVWRTYRDYFYDPNMHGLDWNALREHYGSLLDDAITRWDVNFIIGELIGEVNSSHTYVGGGDIEQAPRRPVGLLGIDWALDSGAYRVARILGGAPWDGGEHRSPLAEPGVAVAEGDYILAVNGVTIDTARDPFAAFEGLGDQTVALTVNDGPTMEGAREVLVETMTSEFQLRNREWIEHNRQRVLEASDGRIGYIYVPDTSVPGQTALVRQLSSQIRLPGLIIDERFNAGGQLPDRFIEKVNRQMVVRIFFRHGGTITHPTVSHYGAKAMLINGWAGSGGDAFPFFFKEMQVGPLVGERTWGGLIGPAVGHRLIDGGRFTAPPGRLYGVDGVWFAEGHGVDPDIPVIDDPNELAKGIDPQLEAAINAVLEQLAENPPVFADPPEFEVR